MTPASLALRIVLYMVIILGTSAGARGLTVDAGGTVKTGTGSTLAIVGGRPAIAYTDEEGRAVYYVRATDASGTSWGTPVTVAPVNSTLAITHGFRLCLVVVNGNPALCYLDAPDDSL